MIIQEIRDAFGDMPYPGTEYITNDLEGNDLERNQIREGFSRYEDWQDVPRELLLQERDALPLFEPQGFRFYLPAYMLFALEDYEGADMKVLCVYLISTIFNTCSLNCAGYVMNKGLSEKYT